jgi:hypothetical protein
VSTSADGSESRDAAYWAKPVTRLNVSEVPAGALNLNVEGRRVVGPIQGFGQLWQKTFRVRLVGISVAPAEVIRVWKEHFTTFWPAGSQFYAPIAGIAPGEVALISLSALPGPIRLSTGVMVLYADDESFTLMTPEGHMLAGWITFSAVVNDDGETVVQVQALERTNDLAYEIGALLIAHRMNNRFWEQTLRNLGKHFGVDAPVETQVVCVDRSWQWSRAGNLWQNAAIRSGLYLALAPLRWLRHRGSVSVREHPVV